jgi:hypothetical protein
MPDCDDAKQHHTEDDAGEAITKWVWSARRRGEAPRDLVEDSLRAGLLAQFAH